MYSRETNLSHHGYLIHKISHDFKLRKNESLRKYNLTDSQMKVMRCLWNKDNVSQTELLKIINIKSSSLTRLLDQLEKKGFVIRTHSSTDCRVKLVSLTEKGKLLKKESWSTILELERKLVNDFSEKEKEISLSILKRMLDNINTKGDET